MRVKLKICCVMQTVIRAVFDIVRCSITYVVLYTPTADNIDKKAQHVQSRTLCLCIYQCARARVYVRVLGDLTRHSSLCTSRGKHRIFAFRSLLQRTPSISAMNQNCSRFCHFIKYK